MFIRVKKIKKDGKSYPYAYLVDNKWYKRGSKKRGKGSRQKVVKYLGRVYSFEKVSDDGFFEYIKIKEEDTENYIRKTSKNKIIKDLVRWELGRHEADKEFFLKNNKIMREEKEVSLKINEGLLCTYTLSRLLNFKFLGDERKDGFSLAKYFVEAGIEVPKEIFIGIFGKGYVS